MKNTCNIIFFYQNIVFSILNLILNVKRYAVERLKHYEERRIENF